MIFTINGLNIVPFIAGNGIKWQRNDVESADAGRTMDALMHRGRVAIKARADISCLWMTKQNAYQVLQAIMPEYVTVVTDTIPWAVGTVTLTMYSNNVPAKCLTEYSDGTQLFGDVEFPLIER